MENYLDNIKLNTDVSDTENKAESTPKGYPGFVDTKEIDKKISDLDKQMGDKDKEIRKVEDEIFQDIITNVDPNDTKKSTELGDEKTKLEDELESLNNQMEELKNKKILIIRKN